MNDTDKEAPAAQVPAAATTATPAPSPVPAPASPPSPAPVPTPPHAARSLAPLVLVGAAAVFLYGLVGGLVLRVYGIMDVADKAPDPFPYLYAAWEPAVMFGMMALCILFAIFIDNKTRVPDVWPLRAEAPAWRRLVYGLLPLLVLAAGVIGTFAVMYDYPLGPDEYMEDYQALALARGYFAIPVPPQLAWMGDAIRPGIVSQHTVEGATYWIPAHFSGYAVLRGTAMLLGLHWLPGPLLTAGSVVLITLIARQLWPERPFSEAELIAAALLAVAGQGLMTGMTAFATPALLFCNLLWLWLYLRNSTASLVLAGVVGAAALLLGRPMLHFLFVAPLLVRLLLMRRWVPAAGFAAVYVAGLYLAAGGLAHLLLPEALAGAGVAGFSWAGLFSPPPWTAVALTAGLGPVTAAGSAATAAPAHEAALYVRSLALPLFFSWQALPILPLGLAALWNWRALPPAVRDLAAGMALVLLFVAATSATQGFGWGHREGHAVLGSAVLLAAAGWPWFAASAGRGRAGVFLCVGLAVALAGQLPYRVWTAEQIVRGYAISGQYLALQQERFILLDVRYKWNGEELVRNGPFFDNPLPIIIRTQTLTAMNRQSLGAVLDHLRTFGTIKLIKPDDLTPYGLATLSETSMRATGILNRDGTAVKTAPLLPEAPPGGGAADQPGPTPGRKNHRSEDIPPPPFPIAPPVPPPPG